jgi:ribosomal-protein-alanine N-acetyltransferase
MNIPTLHTSRLTLRGFTPADFEPLCAILADRDVLRYLPRTEPYPPESVQRIMQHQKVHWDKLGFGWYALADRLTGELIGWCGLGVLEDTDETEIKYLLKKTHWGRGLASEGAQFCVEAGFCQQELSAIIGLVHPQNLASRRVLEKCRLSYLDRVHYWGIDLDRLIRYKE